MGKAFARVKRKRPSSYTASSYCKKIRNDRNYWQRVDDYVSEHSEAQFSHGICPECYEQILTHSSGRCARRGPNRIAIPPRDSETRENQRSGRTEDLAAWRESREVYCSRRSLRARRR